ncbi:MAG: hypothetical protein IJ593_05040 [Lachnospiraceae bacterium]|nr:hypothetical protein [Lachnospiraceae bacterium]
MRISKLMEFKKSGALKMTVDTDEKSAVVGGCRLQDSEIRTLCENLGWSKERNKAICSGIDMVKKTDSFLTALDTYVKDERVFGLNVTFESMRKSGTMDKTYERIKLVSDDGLVNITLLHNMTGLRSYAIFESNKSISQPSIEGSGYKAVLPYIEVIYRTIYA